MQPVRASHVSLVASKGHGEDGPSMLPERRWSLIILVELFSEMHLGKFPDSVKFHSW